MPADGRWDLTWHLKGLFRERTEGFKFLEPKTYFMYQVQHSVILRSAHTVCVCMCVCVCVLCGCENII